MLKLVTEILPTGITERAASESAPEEGSEYGHILTGRFDDCCIPVAASAKQMCVTFNTFTGLLTVKLRKSIEKKVL